MQPITDWVREHLVWGLAVLSLARGAGPALAQGPGERVYELGEVIVSGHRDSGVESVGTVWTVTAAEMRDQGAQTLDEALRLIPGLQVRVGAAGTPRIDIRGFRSRHVQLLLDGVPINDSYDGQFDPTTLPVEFIERIKVTTGGGSVLYGPGGNGGVINIITRHRGQGVRGSITGLVEQDNTRSEAATLSGGTGEWQVTASSRTFHQDAYRLSGDFRYTREEGGHLRDNSDLDRNNGFVGVRYTPSTDTRLGLTLNLVQGENGLPPATNYDQKDPFSSKPKYLRTNDLNGYGVQLAFAHKLDPSTNARGWTFYNRLETRTSRYDDATYSSQSARGASYADVETRIAGGNFQLRRSMGLSLATLGIRAEDDAWDANGFIVGKKGKKDSKGSKDSKDEKTEFDGDRNVAMYSVALQLEAWPRNRLGLVLGGAYHVQDRKSDTAGDFSYQMGAWYDLGPGTKIRGSVVRKVRFPSIRQLYDPAAGDARLTAERSLHGEVGAEQRWRSGTLLTVSGFWTEARDFIEKDAQDRFRNFEKYRFRGVELAAEQRLRPALLLRAAYSYLHTEDCSSGAGRDQLQYRPRDKFTAESTWKAPFGLTTHLSVLHVGGQYFYDRDKKPPLAKERLADYTVVDLDLRVKVLDGRMDLQAGVRNLLDEDYALSYGFPQAGRTAYAGTRIPF